MSKLRVTRGTTQGSRRRARTRAHVMANPELPRLIVFRSNRYIFAQVVDQKTGKAVGGTRAKKSEDAGKGVAEKAIKAGITKVVFDKGKYRYHGRVKLLAESARKAGLVF